jgi:hypothetical protein
MQIFPHFDRAWSLAQSERKLMDEIREFLSEAAPRTRLDKSPDESTANARHNNLLDRFAELELQSRRLEREWRELFRDPVYRGRVGDWMDPLGLFLPILPPHLRRSILTLLFLSLAVPLCEAAALIWQGAAAPVITRHATVMGIITIVLFAFSSIAVLTKLVFKPFITTWQRATVMFASGMLLLELAMLVKALLVQLSGEGGQP